jgi:hypothetical protein
MYSVERKFSLPLLSLSLFQQEEVLPPNVTFMRKGSVGQQQLRYW